MIRVTVEILPGGFAERRRMVGVMQIANISDLAPLSDYRVEFIEGANPITRTEARAGTVYIRSHDRRQSVWCLISAALAALARVKSA